MKNYLLLFIFSSSIFTLSFAQDFYGANFTGVHTVGAFVKYDGNVGVGLQYNYKKFNGPFSRPVNINTNVGIQIDQGISKVDLELGSYQIYANTATQKFGVGTGLTFKGDYCLRDYEKVEGVDGKTPCDFSLTGSLNLRPGYYGNNFSGSATARLDYLRFGFGNSKLLDNNSDKVEVAAFRQFNFGAHFDYVNRFGNSVHVTYDIENTVYAIKDVDKAWNTLKAINGLGNRDDGDYDCAIPEMNLQQRISLSASF